jgi:hypothetical protein
MTDLDAIRARRPSDVFRYVPRRRRAEYVEMMRGSMTVAWRDFGRALDRLYREVRRAF